MQIAGSECKVCKRKIVFSQDAKFCGACEVVVHHACESRINCHVCGRAFADDERPGIDPIREAILPRALRDSMNAGPSLALVTGVVGGLIVIMYYVIMEAVSHGH